LVRKGKGDRGRGSGVTNDEWLYREAFLPPVKEKQVAPTMEEFAKLLKIQQAVKTPELRMSNEEFMKTLTEQEKYGGRRGTRTLRQRVAAALDWFDSIEETWWCREQTKILRHLDKKDFDFRIETYRQWRKEFVKQCKRAYRRLKKEKKHKIAEEFMEEAWRRIEAAKPVQAGMVEQTIIHIVRKLTIQRRWKELKDFEDEIRPLLPIQLATEAAT